jgi:hypothetical protein
LNADVDDRHMRKQDIALAEQEIECGVDNCDNRVRRARPVLLTQVRQHNGLVRIAAERGDVEKLGEELDPSAE